MKVKQVRLAQSIPGTASNLLEKDKYDLAFDKGMLTVKLKHNPKKLGDFVVFPANIAWIETEPEASQEEAVKVDKPAGKQAKNG